MNRTAILNRLCRRFGNPRYLEIGCGNGRHFGRIGSSRKTGIDPVCRDGFQPTFVGRSDDFFALPTGLFDLVFVDGLHHADQFRRDVEQVLERLAPGGMVVCHDVNPVSEREQRVPRETRTWTGDVWKGWLALRRERPDLEMFVVDCDHGVGMVRPTGSPVPTSSVDRATASTLPPTDATYEGLERNRRVWLNLVGPEVFLDWVKRLPLPENRDGWAKDSNVILFERTAINWRAMNRALFLRQWVTGDSVWGKRRKPGYQKLWEGIERWNAYFEIPYFDYRAELNDLARHTWATASGLDGHLRDFDLLEAAANRKDCWILPTDDDDWYAPQLPAMLKSLDARKVDVVCWNQLRYLPAWSHEEPRRGWQGKLRVAEWKFEERFETNGYAIRSRLLHELGRERFRELVLNHMAGRQLARRGRLRVVGLPAVYAAKNHSPASIMNLRGADHARFELLAQRMARPLPALPEDAKWAAPWLAEAEALNARLGRLGRCSTGEDPEVENSAPLPPDNPSLLPR